jgi:DsbC/DsbD-like thiol-disulfide interchange protein
MYSRIVLRHLLLSLGLVLAWVRNVGADSVSIPHGTIELVAETGSIRPGHSFFAGLNFHLEPGWHIYWINPGDAGEPPRVTWRLPAGISAGPIEWPLPQALPAFSDMDFGYQNQVLLLVPMMVSAGVRAAPADIAAEVKLIVCREVCIPGKARVELSLPISNRAATRNLSVRKLFDAARKQLPRPAPTVWKFKATSQKDSFRLTGTLGHPIKTAFFFPLEPSQIENAAPQTVQPAKAGFAMTLKKSEQLLQPIRDLKGVLLLGDRAYVIAAPVE